MAEEKKYFLRTVYTYGHVSTVESELLKSAQPFRNNVFHASALDRFVLKLKAQEAEFLKEHPKRTPATVSLVRGISRTGLPYAAVKIGWHLVWFEEVREEIV